MTMKTPKELRQRVYPRWVADGRLTEAKSERQIAVMQAVLATLDSAENWGLS
jgi:hypothetical protein